jgi:hypothetical protein
VARSDIAAFVVWLRGQRDRRDSIGGFARYFVAAWDNGAADDVRSISSLDRHLQKEGFGPEMLHGRDFASREYAAGGGRAAGLHVGQCVDLTDAERGPTMIDCTTLTHTDDTPMTGFYQMIADAMRIPRHDLEGREIVCTPCGGRYGRVAYWLLTVNGSPPRGAVLYDAGRNATPVAFLIAGCQSRRLGASQARAVERFVATYLAGGRGQELDEVRPVTVHRGRVLGEADHVED